MIKVARTPGARSVTIFALAFALLIASGVTGASLAASSAADGASGSQAVIGPMSVGAEGENVKLTLDLKGKAVMHLAVSQTPPGSVLRIENASFEKVPAKLEIGDGIIDAVECSKVGDDAVIAIKLAKPLSVAASSSGEKIEILVGPQAGTAKVAAAEEPVRPAAPVPAAKPEQEFGVAVLAKSLEFSFGKTPSKIDSFVLSDGVRLVVDMKGVDIPSGQYVNEYVEGPVGKIVMRQNGENVRLVAEARSAGLFDGYTIAANEKGFAVKMAEKAAAAPAVQAKAEEKTEKAVAAAARAKPTLGGGIISDLGFRQDADKSYIELALSKPAEYEVGETTDTKVVLDIKDTALTKKFERALDTSAFNGPVSMISAYGRGPHTRLVIDLKKSAPFKIEKSDAGLVIAFEGGQKPPLTAAEKAALEKEKLVLVTPDGKPVEPAKAKETAEKPAEAKTAGTLYTGQKISMDFVEADIRNVLRIIGEISNMNVVTGSEVTGKMTIRLVEVPWDQALDVILAAKGLDKEVEGNVMRIVAAEKIAAERAARKAEGQTTRKEKEELGELISDLIPVSYADAAEVMSSVKTVLSKRGSLAMDKRTNTLLIRDMAEHIAMAKGMVGKLDAPTPQVLIEARIVEVVSNFTRDLGIQWGGAFQADPARGNAPNNGFPNSVKLTGSTGLDNYAINFPASVGDTGGAALSLSLGSINDILSLDLRLSAMETSGKGRVISSPRVATLDNRPAEISQGTQIPISTATTEKISTQTVDYLLKLSVTPHVTFDNSIVLKIEIKKDDVDDSGLSAAGASAPPKSTRSATTEVLVRDGETTVIGGIITDKESKNDRGVPWFQDLPLFGWLFKEKKTINLKTELIIFITPRILRLEPTAQAGK